jgi:DNA-binding NarL/FixJ family response regulator
MIKLLIADDHTMFLNGLRMLLATNPNYHVMGTAQNGTEVLDILNKEEIDVVLMDINMPVLSGYDATIILNKRFPNTKIIVLSMLADAASVRKMLEAGAQGYIFKNAGEEELFEAIDTVAQEAYFVTEGMQDVLQDFLKKKKDVLKGYEKMETNPLSQREIEILKMIMDGNTNNEIADKLFLSNRTVDTHRKNILAKLQLKNTAALVKYATEKAVFLGIT